MNEMNVDQLLSQMRAMAAASQSTQTKPTSSSELPDFSAMLKSSIDSVNETQKASGALSDAFEMGDPSVDLADVMISMQKASVSFQAMVQVRNKLVAAYEQVMNMPV